MSVPQPPWTPASVPTPEQVVAGLKATDEGGADLVQLLTPEGERVPDERFDGYAADVGVAELKDLYRDLVLVRRFDREANALQRQGQLGIWVPLLGQEAAQIGAGRAMQPQDMAFPSYREHGVAWCRGIDPTALLGIFRGTDQGSWDPKATRFHLYTIVIGNQCLNATGYAMGQKFESKVGEGPDAEATICFFGDGATSQGDVHEGFVWAAVYDAPVVFYCQNNQWAISEPTERQTRVPLYKRAQGYGFPGIRVDGNDVLACLAVTRWALEECRTGNGPVLIEAFTYRMDAHTTSDDPTRYRLADELELWKLKDPIERVRVHLVRSLVVEQEFFDGIEAESDALAARFRQFCVDMPAPGPERIFSEVYAEESPSGRGRTRGVPGLPRLVRRGRVMATLTLAKALGEGMRAAMERDPKVIVMGEDVGKLGGVFRVTDGLQKDFGEQRVLDTPLAESGIIGTAVGLAIRGFRPVCEIQFDGFVFPGYDQIVSQLAKLRYRSQGRVPMPVVVRIPFGGGIGAVEHHSESPEALFAHVPGLKVVACSNPVDAYWMIQQAIATDDPVIFFEPKRRYWEKAEVDLAADTAAVTQRAGGAARVHAHARRLRRRAQDVPGGGHRGGRGRQRARGGRPAHPLAARPGPGRRVGAPHRAAGGGRGGAVGVSVAAEVAARVQEQCFHSLEAPVLRVTGFDTPYPPSKCEEDYLPDLDRVLDAVDRSLAW